VANVIRRADPELRAIRDHAIDAYRTHVRDCGRCMIRPQVSCPARVELAHAVWHAEAECEVSRQTPAPAAMEPLW
jgi:hypothetical protein